MTEQELWESIKALRARIMGLERENRELKEAVKECVERMNEGGTGTRSFVYEKLIEALEGDN